MFETFDQNVHILTDSEFEIGIHAITSELEKCKQSGYFYGCDSKKLYYEYFLCENATASVIIVHGLSEFTKKYYEMTYYFLQSGFNVFMFDQRCHGMSERLTDVNDLIHVDNFKDYVFDLDCFIETIVCKACAVPLYVYSHSMGGAVTLLYLAKHKNRIQKAVLSAPMIQPLTDNVPLSVTRLGAYIKSLFCGKKSKFFADREFNPEAAEKHATDSSRNRFKHNLNLRIQEPQYRTTPLSSWWIYNAVMVRSWLRRCKIVKTNKTPLLLVTATNDDSVNTDRHFEFAKRCNHCETMILQDATHSILTCNHQIITQYITGILDFFKK